MARVVARNVEIFGGGRDLSGRSNSVTLTFSAEAPEVTAFRDSTRQRLPGGLRDSELTADGFFDNAASQMDENLNAMVSASAWWALFPITASGSKAGREFAGILTEYSAVGAVADAATVSFTVPGSAPFYFVNSLGHTTVSGCWAGSQAISSVDFSGSAASGMGFFRLFEISGTNPEVGASLQHSGNDSTWTTLLDFGAASVGNTATGASYSSASRYRRLKYIFAGTSPFGATLYASSGS
jgi:hypothetical protein